MISTQEANDLLKEPKIATKRRVDLSETKISLDLFSENDEKLKFNLHINQSEKIRFKLTYHNRHETVGLLRLDYNGRHKNPVTITDNVPSRLHKYAGKIFDISEPHMHVYVEGFNIDWALPLNEYEFPVMNISAFKDIILSFGAFGNVIHLKTKMAIDIPLLK